MTSPLNRLFTGLCMLWLANPAHALSNEIIHYPAASSIPVAAAVEVSHPVSTIYLSGKLPPLQDSDQSLDNPLAYGGNTKAQTLSVLGAIEDSLADMGLGLGDIVKLQVFLVGDPALQNRMDMEGFMEGYIQFFGTKTQPNLPARTVVQIAGLPNRGALVEIDTIVVRRNAAEQQPSDVSPIHDAHLP